MFWRMEQDILPHFHVRGDWQERTCCDGHLVIDKSVHHCAFCLCSSLTQGLLLEIVDHLTHAAWLAEIVRYKTGCTALNHLNI